MTHDPALARPRRGRVLAAVAAALVAAAGALVPATAAHAEPRVSITVADRPELGAVADSTYLTEVVVSGSGFQSIRNGFGGIYVLFGWADGSWRPSQGGTTGSDYRYVYDDETNPVGYQLFVTFPGSSTAYAANGGTIAEDGSWSATMRIPGPRFQAYDRSGNISEVDCLQVQCGIMTIGAHGVINANNESFTPISFQEIYSAADGRQVISQTGSSAPVAVAPQSIGGRPAIIPASRTEAELETAADGGVTAKVGRTRLTVTVPGAAPDAWLGVSLHSDPIFAGWYSPSSQGVIDVDLPENLPPGEHRVVIVDANDALLGWAGFEWGGLPDATETAAPVETSGAAPQSEAPPGDAAPEWLVVAAIAAGVLAVLAIAAFVVVLVRTRRPRAAALPNASDKEQ